MRIPGRFIDLRTLRVEDAELTLGWRLSDRAGLLNRGAATVEQQRSWIASRPESEYNFVIEDKAGVPLGMLSLIDVSPGHRRAESARFLIGDEQRAKAIPAAVEAMKLLYEFAFETLKLERIYGTVVAANPLMLKWQKYLGMKEEGRLRRHLNFDGTFHDAIFVGILAEEYRSVALPRMNSLIALSKAKEGVSHDQP